MTLRHKLLLALSPLALALLVLGGVSRWTAERLGQQSQVILQDNYRSILAMERVQEGLRRLDAAVLRRLAGLPGPDEGAELRRLEEELLAQEGNVTEPGEREATRRLRGAWDAVRAAHEGLRHQAGEEARRGYFEALQAPLREAAGAASAILTLNQDAMTRKSDQASRLAEQMAALVTLAAVLALLLGLLLSSWWTTRLMRPLRELTRVVRRLGEGDLQARAALAGRDEIAELGREFDTLAARLLQYRQSSLGELLQAQQAAQAAIDSLPDPVLVCGVGEDVLNANQAAEGLGVALDASEAPLRALAPELREAVERARGHVMAGKGPYTPRGFEEAVRTQGAEGERYLLPRAAPLYGERGEVVGAAVVLQDVTRLRRFDELKNDLVATVAHEFRTPLTSLHLAIHLCLEEAAGPITEKQADLLHAARQDCERLQGIVDELLDLARLQAGRIELQLEPADCDDLCAGAVEAHQGVAAEHGLLLRGEVVPGLPLVRADRERLPIVLSNLITNAVRHTPAGGTVRLRVTPEGGGRVRFEVIDTGEGVALEHQGRIFERFARVPGGKRGGAGLGLALCREIVTAHQGEIGVVSAPGQGATFWFTLPVAAPQPSP